LEAGGLGNRSYSRTDERYRSAGTCFSEKGEPYDDYKEAYSSFRADYPQDYLENYPENYPETQRPNNRNTGDKSKG
jgi:hypothetical protein